VFATVSPAQRQGPGKALLKELAESLLGEGFTGMIVWVLEKNPSRHFYVRSSAQIVTTKNIQIGGDAIWGGRYLKYPTGGPTYRRSYRPNDSISVFSDREVCVICEHRIARMEGS
jgi:hypothetical protein